MPPGEGGGLNPADTARSLRSRQTITLALLFVAGVINFFDRTALSVANTTIRRDMHLSATDMGWLLSAFSLAYGFAQLPLVAILQRAGTRLVLGAGLGIWSTAQLLTGFVRGFPQFLALRVLLGAGESPFYPAGVHIVREWFPDRTRGRATAVMSMSQTLGLAAAPPILAFLILRIGWRMMFVVLGGAGLLAAIGWLILYRQRSDTGHRVDTREARGQAVWATLLQQRMVWGMMLGFGGINYTVWLYTAWLPGYLQEARHLSLARTGWVTAIPFLAGAVGMLASGVVTDHLASRGVALTTAHRRNLVLGMILSAGSTFFVARSVSTPLAVAGISGALFFIHFAGTSGWGYAQTVVEARLVASLSALQNFASFLVASAAPVVTGWLLDRTHSFTISLAVCSAITLLGALSYATLAAPTPPAARLPR